MTGPAPVPDDALQRLLNVIHSDTLPGGAILAGRYEVRERVGRGGMGDVFRGWDQRLQRTVAIKLVRNERAYDADFRVRFEREAKALAALSHPHILAVHDFGQEQDLLYLVTEFVEGSTLADLLKTRRPSMHEAVRMALQICEALHGAHRAGIVHRDIKPGNILVTRDGWIKVADFGLARFLPTAEADEPTRITVQGIALGTPHYMAPEQKDPNAPVDARTDLYSLGVVVYEMLTGELPIGRFNPPSTKVPSDPRLDSAVMRALAADPAGRFGSVEDFKTELQKIVEASPAPRGFGRWLGIALAGAVLASASGWWFLRKKPEPAPTPDAKSSPARDLRWNPSDLLAGWEEASVDEGYSGLPLPLSGRDEETVGKFLGSARALPELKAQDVAGVHCVAFRRAGSPEIFLTGVEFREAERARRYEVEKRLHPSAPRFRKVRVVRSDHWLAVWVMASRVEGDFERFIQRFRIRIGLPGVSWETLLPDPDDGRLPKAKTEERDAARILKDLRIPDMDSARIPHVYRATYHPDLELLLFEFADEAALIRVEEALADRGRVVRQGCWLGCVSGEESSRRKALEDFLSSKLGQE